MHFSLSKMSFEQLLSYLTEDSMPSSLVKMYKVEPRRYGEKTTRTLPIIETDGEP